MNVVVCIKQTFDTEAKIVLNSKGQIDGNGVHLIVNPYDEYAIEEGIRLKEKFGGQVTAITMRSSGGQEALRTALAMGADKAILISDPRIEDADEWVTAQVLSKAISAIPYDIIITGRTAIDDGSSQVAVRVAENLHIPSVTSILKVEVNGKMTTVTREIDGGTEQVEIALPAVFTAQKGLNEPRYPSLMGLMKAKKKELKIVNLTDLGFTNEDLTTKMKVEEYTVSEARQAGRKLQGDPAQAVRELVKLLNDEVRAF